MSDFGIRKVLIVLDSLELGGAERQAIYLAEFLKENPKTAVHVLGFKPPGRASLILSEKGITCEYLPVGRRWNKKQILMDCVALWQKLREIKPNAIVPYTYWPNLLCGLVWRLSSADVCIWNQRDEGRGIREAILERWSLRNASRVISNSQEGKLVLERKFPFIKPQIIHNGVTLEAPKHDVEWWKCALRIDADTFVVSMVANLHTHKDHLTLIRAWKLFVDRVKNNKVMLVLAGRPGDALPALESLIVDLQLQNSTRFLGAIQDVSGLLNATHLVVFSSTNEGCPNSVLEAMKAGKPVIATDILGTREALGAEYEHLVKPGRPDELAEKFYVFAENKKLAKEVGRSNQRLVEEVFSMQAMQRDYLSLLI